MKPTLTLLASLRLVPLTEAQTGAVEIAYSAALDATAISHSELADIRRGSLTRVGADGKREQSKLLP